MPSPKNQAGVEVLEDFYFIERGYLSANHFAYRAERPVLVDTGYISRFSRTEEEPAGVGVDAERVGLIVATHTHSDHIGGNARIQERSGCGIALHPVGRHYVESGDKWSMWWTYYDQEAELFDPTQSLEDGEILPIGPHRFRVLHTPGHASDGIVLYEEEGKVLLSSDALWEDDLPVVTAQMEGSRAPFLLLETQEKLESLDVRVIYPGHGPPFTDLRSAVSHTREKVEGYLEDPDRLGDDVLKRIFVYSILMRGSVQEETFLPYLMSTAWFPDTIDFYFNGAYREKFREIVERLVSRGVLVRREGELTTTVRP